MTNNIYKELIEVGRTSGHHDHFEPGDEIVAVIREIVTQTLHPRHESTLAYLMHHLKKIADHDENIMNAQTLGIAFAPVLFRPR